MVIVCGEVLLRRGIELLKQKAEEVIGYEESLL